MGNCLYRQLVIRSTPVILPRHLCFELKCFHSVNSFTFTELKGETGWQTVSLFNVQELMKGREVLRMQSKSCLVSSWVLPRSCANLFILRRKYNLWWEMSLDKKLYRIEPLVCQRILEGSGYQSAVLFVLNSDSFFFMGLKEAFL